MHDVFISYSSRDMVQAETVRNVLEKNGIPCWMAPRDIPGGSNYTKEIPTAIRQCQVFVLILSQHAQSSHWVLKELDSAVNCGKTILPFMLEDCELNDEFNFLLTGAQRYAAYQKKAEALEKLVTRIHALVGRKPEQTEAPPEPVVTTPPVEVTLPPETKELFAEPVCPACGSYDLAKVKKNHKRYGFFEYLTLLIPILGGLILGFSACVFWVMVSNQTSFLLMLVMWVVCGLLVEKLTMDWLWRRRVRNHLSVEAYRCKDCEKRFLAPEQK